MNSGTSVSTQPHRILKIVFLCDPYNSVPWVPEDIFFLSILMVRGEAASTRREALSGALSNRTQGLFHIRYFENGPLEPG